MDDKDYDSINGVYVGSHYGDLRRERKDLMRRAIFDNDESVKPRIRQITQLMHDYIKNHYSAPLSRKKK
jgi:hypothetical protein